MKIASFEQCLWVIAIDLFTLHLKSETDELISIDMPLTVAAQMVSHADAALKQIEAEGKPIRESRPPEKVLRYNAKKSTTETGEVSMLLVLDRSKPLRARLLAASVWTRNRSCHQRHRPARWRGTHYFSQQ